MSNVNRKRKERASLDDVVDAIEKVSDMIDAIPESDYSGELKAIDKSIEELGQGVLGTDYTDELKAINKSIGELVQSTDTMATELKNVCNVFKCIAAQFEKKADN